jgi:hypothetical protein
MMCSSNSNVPIAKFSSNSKVPIESFYQDNMKSIICATFTADMTLTEIRPAVIFVVYCYLFEEHTMRLSPTFIPNHITSLESKALT